MTLREYIEKEARKLYLATYPPEERSDEALWWDSPMDDTLKDDLRSIALQHLMDKELP